MTTEKDHVKGKLDVAVTLGEGLDKALEAAEFEAQQCVGAEGALKEAASKILLLHTHIDQDLEEGKIPGDPDRELLSYIKKKVTQAHESCMNLSELAKAKQLVANGKAAALRPAVQMAQRQADSAKARLEQLYAAERHAQELAEALEAEKAGEAEDEEDQPKAKRAPGTKPKSKLDGRRAAARKKKVSAKKK